MAIQLKTPLTKDSLALLNAGDEVLISGEIFTARDVAHERILKVLESDNKSDAQQARAGEIKQSCTDAAYHANKSSLKSSSLPYGLTGATIFYAGPTPAAAGRPLGSVGPTTASRMDAATPALMDAGLVACIGKGKRNEVVRKSCKRCGCVYFVCVGGIAALLAECVESSELVAWEDLGTEALRRLTVRNFPAYVGIDTHGRDIYREIEAGSWD